MKVGKMLAICALVIVFAIGLAACGSAGTGASNENNDNETTAGVTEFVVPTPDPSASVDDLIGSWINIDVAERYANISKNDSAYTYEDNEGSYNSVFEGGVLKISVAEGETADAYLDAVNKYLVVTYSGTATIYKKK